ncbi:hypothetical protein BDR06DRAFT_1034503 [Suillus hirtellus]|nr:hypothetical protein BDR06DRAFT_1034503 [Suillus hirtellus]
MSLLENTTVLVVGAGPAGVTAALSLAHHGCYDFVIVDAVAERLRTSRAVTIHSATVEALASIDAVDGLVSQAIRGKGFKITSRSSQIFKAKFDSLKKHSAHPYALYIPQNVTELVLEQKLQSLGVQVQRPHRGSLTQKAQTQPKMHWFKWSLQMSHSSLNLSIHSPSRATSAARTESPRAPPKEYTQKLIDIYGPAFITSDPSLNPRPVKVDQLVWSTCHRSHSAIADHIFTRFEAAIFLVGDAAHIHSPAGGQGMNLGMRDAIFLTEAITKHIQASAENPDGDDTILQEIADARHARALETIGFTKTLSNLASLTYDPYAWRMPFSGAFVRDLVLRILGGFDCVQSKVAWGLSGLGRR